MANVKRNSDEGKVVREVRAFYEYAGSHKETLESGLRCITSSEDPRWEDELEKAPFKGRVRGYLTISEITEVDGEILKRKPIKGRCCHPNKARETMRTFEELKAKGAEKPWDMEHYHRDLKEAAERAQREGNLQQIELLREMFAAVLKGNAVSHGSPVGAGK